MKPINVLIIDDDRDFCDLLSEYLAREGFLVNAVHDGLTGYENAQDSDINIIILDVMLPKMNGFDVLKKIKATQTTPILMLTAKGDEADQLMGLNIGADDYLPKPCSPRLIVARCRAILRRTETTVDTSEKIQVGDLCVDFTNRTTTVNHHAIELTNSEYKLLCCLIKEAGKIVSKEALSAEGLNRKIEAFDRSVDMHISHLRNKLDNIGCLSPKIRTIRGIGYLLET